MLDFGIQVEDLQKHREDFVQNLENIFFLNIDKGVVFSISAENDKRVVLSVENV